MHYRFSSSAATCCLLQVLLSSASALPTGGEAISNPPSVAVDTNPEAIEGEKHL